MSPHSGITLRSMRLHCSSSHTSGNLARGTVAALLILGLAGCGRRDEASSREEVATGAAVTGTAPVIAASSGTTAYSVGAGAVVVDPNLSLTISDNSDLAGVQVSISTGYVSGQDVLSWTPTTGVTGSFNTTTGVLTLTGTVPVTTYQAVLRTVTYNNTGGLGANTQARQVAFSVGATSLAFGGHYYEFVSTGLNWTSAKAAAAAKTYYGLAGYLATITGSAENSFINAKLTATGWIGASDAAVEGTWRWVTGPENGQLLSYTNWAPGEPNNYGSGEDYAQFYFNGVGTWNDLDGTGALGYVVEYGGTAGDPAPQVSTTKNLSVSFIPNYTITATAGTDGAISPAGASTVQQGQSAAYTITPNTNCKIADVKVDGASVGAVASYTFTNVTANHTIAATFTPPTIAVSAGNNQSTRISTAFGVGLSVLVTSTAGTPLAGATVVFTAPASGAAATFSGSGSATTNASGIATVTATANAMLGGLYTVTATVSGTSASTTFSLRNIGAPSSITVVSGSGQSAAAAGAFAAPLISIVRDALGIAVPGATVSFSVGSSGGATAVLTALSGTTDSSGQLSMGATAGNIAGTYTVSASTATVATPAVFSLTNVNGPASVIAVVSGSGQSAAVGAAFGAPLIVAVTDSFGNVVSGVPVTFAAPSSGATAVLGATMASTAATGRAQITAMAGTVAGGYSVTASISSGASTTFPLTNATGAASMLTVTGGSGQTTNVSTPFSTPLTVKVMDAYGNPRAGATITFSAPGTGASAVLSPSSATTSASGTASVTATANTSAGSYNVTASTSGTTSVMFALTNQLLLALSPSTPTVAPRASLTFTATGGSGNGYVFSLTSAPSGGSIDATTGAYHAGATPNTVDVVSVKDSQDHTATTSVAVGPGLSLSADKALVPPRGAAVFTATAGAGLGFIFVISTNNSGGTLDAAGNYKAGSHASVTDTITVTDLVGNIATATIAVGPSIALVASASHTPPRGGLSFSATGGNLSGYVFALATNASGGSINASTGAYLAGSTPGVVDVVSVTDALGNVATRNVAVDDGVSLSPPSRSVAPMGHQTFTASGGSGTGFVYSLATNASGGSIDGASGAYVAGSTPNRSDLIKVVDSLGNTATASVSVGGGITVSPSTLSAPPRGTQTFVANGGSTAGFMFALTTNGSGGTINPTTGVYVAGPTGPSADVLTVTDSLGNSTTINIAVTAGLVVTPATATRAPLGHVALTVSGGSGDGYTFSVSTNLSGATVAGATGNYAAGSTGSVTDVVTVLDSLGNSATATIMVTAALIPMTPTVSVTPRGTTTVGAAGGVGPYVYQLTSNGSGGSIDPNTGVYVAGGQPLSTDVITVTDGNGATTTVVINIGEGVALVPASPAAPPRGSIAFGVTGGSGSGYVYTLAMNASGATLDPTTGAYVAGPKGDVADVVSVRDSLGNTTQVTIAVGGHLVVNPSTPLAAPRQPITFVATGGSNAGYVYTLDTNGSGGTIDAATGIYVAGLVGNTSDVVTVTDSLGNTTTTTITIGALLAVVPEIAVRAPRQSLQFTAQGGSGTGYQYALSTNASHATIDDGGVYTAGSTGNVVDIVTVTDSLGNVTTASVSVGQAVLLTSSEGTIPPHGTASILASGGSLGGYTFVLRSNGSGGSITATTGDYLAGDTPNTTDVIEATDAFGNTGSLVIKVGPGVSISPAAPAAPPRGSITLTASGGSNTGFTFTWVSNESGGMLDSATGMYTAGALNSAVDVVSATDSLGNSATVSIAVGDGLAVNPTEASVAPRGTVQLVAAGGSGTGYMFAVTVNASTGATVDASTGLYTAGYTGNVDDVVTITDSLGNTGTATISVTDGLRITPAMLDLPPLGAVAFAASGGSGSGYIFTLVSNGSHATMDPTTGSYRAGAAGSSTDVLSVTDSLGNVAMARVHVGAVLSLQLPVGSETSVPPRGKIILQVTGGASGVTFKVSSNMSGATISPTTGIYVAGAAGMTVDTVTAVDDNGAAATITVHVGPGVSVNPVTGPLAPRHRETLVATGGSSTGYQWTMVSAGSGGSVDVASGAYVAGPHIGTDVIAVQDSLGNTSQIQLAIVGTSNGEATPFDVRGGGCTCSTGGAGGSTASTAGLALLLGIAAVLVTTRRRRRAGVTAGRGGRSGAPREGGGAGRALLSLALAITALGAAARTAYAQNAAGFALDQFTPAQRGSDWFVLDSLDIHGDQRVAVGMSTTWAYRPLVLTDSGGGVRESVMTNQLVSHVGASLILIDRVRFGVDVPFQLFGDGHTTTVAGMSYGAPASSSSLGDLRLNGTVRLFDYAPGRLTGAFGVTVVLPTGDQSSYAGDTGVGVAPHALIAGQAGLVVYAAQVGATIRKSVSFASTYVGSDLFAGASAGVRLVGDRLLIGPELYGRSVLSGGVFLDRRATPLEAMLGAHFAVTRDWRLGAGLAAGLTGGVGNPTTRGLVSLEWAPGLAMTPSDGDHDGVLDVADACPSTPGVASPEPARNGCPPPAPDSDRDGIADSSDACPQQAGPQSTDRAKNGCPLPPADGDHDGIADASDACPTEPGVTSKDAARNGCPLPPPDRDSDGVADASDACPEEAGIPDPDPTRNGCPDRDRDHDGIANTDDACPNDAGAASPDPKRNGCPKAILTGDQIKILDQVRFKSASVRIQPGKDSVEVLMAVRQILIDHPNVAKVRVEGHTDGVGDAARNRTLSAGRAQAVVKWLVDHGVERDRLTAEGFGPDRPIAPNNTPAGRRENRRVEFHLADPASPAATTGAPASDGALNATAPPSP
jgi:OOP family OmpA-OmpF porin